MKKTVPWIIACVCVAIAVWAVGTRHLVARRASDRLHRLDKTIAHLYKQSHEAEELRATHDVAQRILAQQEERLHEHYEHLHRFVVGTNAIPEYPMMTMVVSKSSGRAADVRITLVHGGGRGAWLPSAYTVTFLNGEGFVTGQINSGAYDTRLTAGQKLSRNYTVEFKFGKPAYFLFERRRQSSFCP